jgi:DNA-binding transcriptional MerR regulator
MEKSADAFRTISEVATEIDVPQHVLRFWESKFSQIKPLKRAGGRRYYRPQDIELLRAIRRLLYAEGFTIRGVQRILKERGARAVTTALRDGSPVATALSVQLEELDENSAESIVTERDEEPADETGAFGPKASAEEAIPTLTSSDPLGLPDMEKLRAILADLERCREILAAAREGR